MNYPFKKVVAETVQRKLGSRITFPACERRRCIPDSSTLPCTESDRMIWGPSVIRIALTRRAPLIAMPHLPVGTGG